MQIEGKHVVVAGGSGNLGSAIVTDLLRRGARVTVLDRQPPRAPAEGAAFAQADAADESAVAAAFASCGPVHVLINCTGLIHSEPVINLLDPARRRHGIDSWNAVIRANLTAAFVLGSVAAEHMAATRTKGVIVNFSSIAASGNPGQTAYAAAKAGVEALTKVWARELGPLGVRVVAIAPGFVDTESTHAALNERALDDLKHRTPLRRLGSTAEIAGAVAFALENDFLTGRTIAIDGGLSI